MENETTNIIIDIIRIYLISIETYLTSYKFVNKKYNYGFIKLIILVVEIIMITMICKTIKEIMGFLYSIIAMILLESILFSRHTKSTYANSLIIITISLSINYILFSCAIIISFLFKGMAEINNEYINMYTICSIYIILIYLFFKIRKFKYGFVFLKRNFKNEYFDMIILNASLIIIFTLILSQNYDVLKSRGIMVTLVVFFIFMFMTIQKSLQLYYKQRMLVKDLEETKEELENKRKEVEALEKENLEFSKVSHSIAHKQKSLEHKLNELSMKSEIADELDIKDRIKNIDKDLREKTVVVLDKTGIDEIDDMLSYMQSECVKNKIDFQLQLNGNIYTMINHHIDKEDLEILLADHIKNAIIAIEYGDNVNKSILVRLGKLDGGYGLYIYDSGIEFEIGTLLNLGKKPSTTHKESGGTGMGFMNTFDTLRKHKASFVIEELGKPVKNNFTKVLKFKFDGKNEFKISSYRKEEIKNTDKDNSIVVEKLSL